MRLFGIYIIIEIVVLVVAGKILGVGLTLFIILATAVLGVLILRLAGLSTLSGVRQKMGRGETANGEMMSGLLLAMGGLLLFLPGLLGDVIGILLVVPATRTLFVQFAKKLLNKYSIKEQNYSKDSYSTGRKPDIIEGEWQKKDE